MKRLKINKERFFMIKNVFVLTMIPVLFTLLFSSVYSKTYVESIPLEVLDLDNSSTTRTIIDMFDNSGRFQVRRNASNQLEIEEEILGGKVSAGIIFPADFEKNLKSTNAPTALMLIDKTNIVIGSNAYSYAATIFGTINVGIRGELLEGGGMMPAETEQYLMVLSSADRILYAPQMGTFFFLFAGFLGLFIQQTFLASLTPFLLDCKFRRQSGRLKEPSFSQGREISRSIKTFLLFGTLTCVSAMICMLLAHFRSGYPIRGSLLLMLAVQSVFLLDLFAVSLFFAAVFKDKIHCTQFLMLLSVPAIMTAGYVWPEFATPEGFMDIVKRIWPLHYYVNPLRDIMMKGAGISEILSYIKGGLLYACFWIPVSGIFFRLRCRIGGSKSEFAQERKEGAPN